MSALNRLLIALFALPLTLSAQAASPPPQTAPLPALLFAYVQYGDTIAFEAVYSDSVVLRGAYLEPKKQRVEWDHHLTRGEPGWLTMSIFAPDTSQFAIQELGYVPKTDSLQLFSRDPGGRRSETVAVSPGTVATFTRSLTHLAYLAFLRVQAGHTSLPLFLTSSGKTVTATLDIAGDSLSITVNGLRVDTRWNGAVLDEVQVPAQGIVVRRLTRL